jgi:hypothetical protein
MPDRGIQKHLRFTKKKKKHQTCTTSSGENGGEKLMRRTYPHKPSKKVIEKQTVTFSTLAMTEKNRNLFKMPNPMRLIGDVRIEAIREKPTERRTRDYQVIVYPSSTRRCNLVL